MLKKIGKWVFRIGFPISLAVNVYFYQLIQHWFAIAVREYQIIQLLKNMCGSAFASN